MSLVPRIIAVTALFLIFTPSLDAKPAKAKALPAPTTDDCLACHSDPEATRGDGKPLGHDLGKFTASIHGQGGLACTDCHADLASAELPHGEKLAKVDCATCHSDATEKHVGSVHKAQSCSGCHGIHDILPSSDPASRTAHANVPATCETCHKIPPGPAGRGKSIKDGFHVGKVLAEYGESAPVCSTCHGAHDILPPKDKRSPMHHDQVAATCGTCHSDVQETWDKSIHAQMIASGRNAATCSDCHAVHGILGTDEMPRWRVAATQECSTCHASKADTYRDTFHGKASNLGYERVATCSDCHGNHAIRPQVDPTSMVSAQNRVATCQKCHPGTGENFAAYDPHADPHDRERNPVLYYATIFMKALLGGTFAFFGLHTALWAPRSLKDRRARLAAHAPKQPPTGGDERGQA